MRPWDRWALREKGENPQHPEKQAGQAEAPADNNFERAHTRIVLRTPAVLDAREGELMPKSGRYHGGGAQFEGVRKTFFGLFTGKGFPNPN